MTQDNPPSLEVEVEVNSSRARRYHSGRCYAISGRAADPRRVEDFEEVELDRPPARGGWRTFTLTPTDGARAWRTDDDEYYALIGGEIIELADREALITWLTPSLDQIWGLVRAHVQEGTLEHARGVANWADEEHDTLKMMTYIADACRHAHSEELGREVHPLEGTPRQRAYAGAIRARAIRWCKGLKGWMDHHNLCQEDRDALSPSIVRFAESIAKVHQATRWIEELNANWSVYQLRGGGLRAVELSPPEALKLLGTSFEDFQTQLKADARAQGMEVP